MFSFRKVLIACAILLFAGAVSLLFFFREEISAARAFPSLHLNGAPWELTKTLTRTGHGPGGSEVKMILATPDYLRLTNQTSAVAQYAPDHNVIFFLEEHLHSGELPSLSLVPYLEMEGRVYTPLASRVIVDSVHHRLSVVAYPGYDEHGERLLDKTGSLEILLPAVNTEGAQSRLAWELPLGQVENFSSGGFPTSGVSLLGLFAGFLAAMWPCLFQLTVYFLPSVAGLSMAEARTKKLSVFLRLQVLKTALFFVLGFVITYTVTGALVGFAAQFLGGAFFLELLRRPLSIVAGFVILVMALRMAIRARAPLVCRMPLGTKFVKGLPEPWSTMVLGIAFTTGCMTCFGAALALGMLAYAFSTASVFSGALIFFFFSLGIGIPLMLAAAAMAQALPLLGNLERLTPWLALASSIVMIFFAILLLTDNYHVISNLFFTVSRAS